jgi:hypothetical protein
MPWDDGIKNSAARTKQRSANIVDARDVVDPGEVGRASGVQALAELCTQLDQDCERRREWDSTHRRHDRMKQDGTYSGVLLDDGEH